jgi:hypothetical protein
MKKFGDGATQVVSTGKEYRQSLIELCAGKSTPLLLACDQIELEITDEKYFGHDNCG